HRVSQGRVPLSQPKVRKILDTTTDDPIRELSLIPFVRRYCVARKCGSPTPCPCPPPICANDRLQSQRFAFLGKPGLNQCCPSGHLENLFQSLSENIRRDYKVFGA